MTYGKEKAWIEEDRSCRLSLLRDMGKHRGLYKSRRISEFMEKMRMKKFRTLFLGIVILITLTNCSMIDSDILSDLAKNSTEVSTVENDDIVFSYNDPVHDDTGESSLDAAVREAIFTENFGNYLPGEFQGIGYKIIETFEDDGVLSVYALSEYVEYGFQDDVFVNVSGTNPKVLMKFRQMESGNYELIFYTRLDLLSDLSEEEIEQLLEPLNKTGKRYVFTNMDLQEVRTQADKAASVYLNSINRVANVGERENHEGKLLTDLVSNEDLILEIIKEYPLYPEWTGTQEKIENNIRYIYQTEYDEMLQQIIFSKILFDTNEIVEQQVIDVQD